jgi:hypothetical protein
MLSTQIHVVIREESAQIMSAQLLMSISLLILECVQQLRALMQNVAERQLSAMKGGIMLLVLPRMFQRPTWQMWIAELLARALTVMTMM